MKALVWLLLAIAAAIVEAELIAWCPPLQRWLIRRAAAPLPPGLVAAYSFDTGSGASVPDVSGNGNTGTAMGAFWSTQGRYGGAMSFDGVSSVVRVASSPSLALSSAMTLSGWINPSVTQSAWRKIQDRTGRGR